MCPLQPLYKFITQYQFYTQKWYVSYPMILDSRAIVQRPNGQSVSKLYLRKYFSQQMYIYTSLYLRFLSYIGINIHCFNQKWYWTFGKVYQKIFFNTLNKVSHPFILMFQEDWMSGLAFLQKSVVGNICFRYILSWTKLVIPSLKVKCINKRSYSMT